jgi:excisionase family DNA binding protein
MPSEAHNTTLHPETATQRQSPGHLLTTQEVAERLRITTPIARAWCRHGVLPAVKIGTRGGERYRIRDSDLEARLDDYAVSPNGEE